MGTDDFYSAFLISKSGATVKQEHSILSICTSGQDTDFILSDTPIRGGVGRAGFSTGRRTITYRSKTNFTPTYSLAQIVNGFAIFDLIVDKPLSQTRVFSSHPTV